MLAYNSCLVTARRPHVLRAGRCPALRPVQSVISANQRVKVTRRVVRQAGEAPPQPAAVQPYELPATIKEGIELGNSFARSQERYAMIVTIISGYAAEAAMTSPKQKDAKASQTAVGVLQGSLSGFVRLAALDLGGKVGQPCGRLPILWATALEVYEKSLTLGGNGVKRFRDKPASITDGERAAALYNTACCHARMGNTVPGLVAVSGALESGYKDFRQLRTDPDLEALRSDARFEGLLARFEPKPAQGMLGELSRMLGGK